MEYVVLGLWMAGFVLAVYAKTVLIPEYKLQREQEKKDGTADS